MTLTDDEWSAIVSDQMNLFAPDALARNSDPDTSHQAARSVNVTKGQQKVYDHLKAIGPSTDERAYELAQERGVPISPSGYRSRRNELVEIHGTVRDTGRREKTRMGNNSIVWEAV